jgi:DNA-binding MarR family transcriptional regulator
VLGLAPQLSAAVVAFTIEADNEFERRVQHVTTRHGGSGERGAVWLSSLAMWFNCLRGLADAGTGLTAAELERRVRMSTNLDGMRRWGYVTIDGVGRVKRGEPKPRPRSESMLALTRRGRAAVEVWRPLPGEIESRWRERFDADAVERLRAALVVVASQFDVRLPDFMPVGSARGVGLSWAAARERAPGGRAREALGAGEKELALVSLLSRVLLALALDYEDGAKLSLGMQLNCLRVLADNGEGVAQRELPSLTGVSKEAISGLVNRLAEVGCVEVVPLSGGARGKRLRLTAERGVRANARGQRRLQRTIGGWGDSFGAGAVKELGDALAPIVGDGTRAGSPLFAGLVAPEEGWRAKTRQPDVLPWFPMVTHRGGFPDGS